MHVEMYTRCTPRISSLHPYDYLLWFMRLVALLYCFSLWHAADKPVEQQREPEAVRERMQLDSAEEVELAP